ncbi:hypothetical protein HU200_010823 [Digitaria exilis]|uniref:Uncharacterized protein n=1 Tax=Digitaria exilis TaxID=1010633 RepID=A0A835KN89_9POAL|nr:hypothetical protein HU200_057313 [Digitaria exilis]KAF8757508.1 hypothetical protein HU200_010823 [Digitaria exilis]
MFDAEGTIIMLRHRCMQFVMESIHQNHMMHASVSAAHLKAEMQSFFEQNVGLEISCLLNQKRCAS